MTQGIFLRLNRSINTLEEKFSINISISILLCIVAQHSFVIKFVGLFILLLLNIKFLKEINPLKIPLFYSIIPSLEVFKFFLLDPNYSNGHIAQFIVGIIYWIASLLACWLIFIQVGHGKIANIKNALKLFAVLNLLFSAIQIIHICYLEGVLNPYNTGHDHPFGISSGDSVFGLLQGVHLTNVFVSVLLILYFADKRNYLFIFITLIPLLLAGSNYGSMVLLASLFLFFVCSKDKTYSLGISTLITAIIVAFYWFITPVNALHMTNKLKNIIGHTPIVDEQYQLETDSIASNYLSSNHTDSIKDKNVLRAIERLKLNNNSQFKYNFGEKSGKITSYNQTFSFIKSEPKYFLFGSGIGGFSSNLAFNFSGIVDNSAMNRYFPSYQNPNFKNNHKSIYKCMKESHVIFHSESNKPFSVYNQLLGEYGLVGFLSFIVFYLYYFFKRVRKTSYALPVMFAVLLAFSLNYYIESLSLLLFFEVLMFLNIREKKVDVSN